MSTYLNISWIPFVKSETSFKLIAVNLQLDYNLIEINKFDLFAKMLRVSFCGNLWAFQLMVQSWIYLEMNLAVSYPAMHPLVSVLLVPTQLLTCLISAKRSANIQTRLVLSFLTNAQRISGLFLPYLLRLTWFDFGLNLKLWKPECTLFHFWKGGD